MSRVTAPLSKVTRSVATSSSALARPAFIHSASKTAGRSEAADAEEPRHFTTTHRPTPQPTPSRDRTVPLMQTFNFQTSAAKAARNDHSTIDYFLMPRIDEYKNVPERPIRVPLLPDNYNPNRNLHGPEITHSKPEILVVAAHPENVAAVSPLTEIEPIAVDGVELKFAHHPEDGAGDKREPGMLHDLWKGLVEDVFGEQKKTA